MKWPFRAVPQRDSAYWDAQLKAIGDAFGLPDPTGATREGGQRLVALCREVRAREEISGPLVSLSSTGNLDEVAVNPALAAELARPENEGALQALKALSRIPRPSSDS